MTEVEVLPLTTSITNRLLANGCYTLLSGLSDSDKLYRYKNKKGVAVQPT